MIEIAITFVSISIGICFLAFAVAIFRDMF